VQNQVALGERKLLGRGVKQLASRRHVKCSEPELRQPGVCECRRIIITGSGQQNDRVRVQATGDEAEHVGCRAVEPVGILGDQQ
jgi:hypothetical protein